MVSINLCSPNPGDKATPKKPFLLELRSSKAFIMVVVVYSVFTVRDLLAVAVDD